MALAGLCLGRRRTPAEIAGTWAVAAGALGVFFVRRSQSCDSEDSTLRCRTNSAIAQPLVSPELTEAFGQSQCS